MIPFTPSSGFVAFFNQIIAAAEAPVTPGSYNPAVPTFPDAQEQAFVQVVLVPMIANINRMKQSVTVTVAISPQVQAYMDQGMTQAEAEGTAQWFANMSTP